MRVFPRISGYYGGGSSNSSRLAPRSIRGGRRLEKREGQLEDVGDERDEVAASRRSGNSGPACPSGGHARSHGFLARPLHENRVRNDKKQRNKHGDAYSVAQAMMRAGPAQQTCDVLAQQLPDQHRETERQEEDDASHELLAVAEGDPGGQERCVGGDVAGGKLVDGKVKQGKR